MWRVRILLLQLPFQHVSYHTYEQVARYTDLVVLMLYEQVPVGDNATFKDPRGETAKVSDESNTWCYCSKRLNRLSYALLRGRLCVFFSLKLIYALCW